MRKPKFVSLFRIGAVLLAAMLLSVAAAQFEAVGTITATLGDEERTWYPLEYQGESSAVLSTMSYSNRNIHSLHIQGHVEETYAVEGVLSIDATFTSELEDCPCVLTSGDVMYFPTSSMFSDIYVSISMEVTIDSIEVVADGVATARGSFSALLGHVADLSSGEGPDPEQTLEIAGEFVIERLQLTD